MKLAKFTILIALFQISFAASAAHGAALMTEAEDAAKAAGFDAVSMRKPKDPFYGSKRKDAKEWTTFEAFPKGAQLTQIAITCNQCKGRKLSEAFTVLCSQDVQKVAGSMKVDLPGEVLLAFEKGVEDEKWDLKVNSAKSLRLQKVVSKCDRGPSGSGYRFDFFY